MHLHERLLPHSQQQGNIHPARKALVKCGMRARVLCSAQSSAHAAGSIRREPRKHAKQAVQDALCQVGERAEHLLAAFRMLEGQSQAQPSQAATRTHQLVRFPCLEFRSLVLNPLVKSMTKPFPDRAMWNKHKVQVAETLLELANGSSKYQTGLQHLVDLSLERDSHALQRTLQDDTAAAEDKDRLKCRYEQRKTRVTVEFDKWCKATVGNPHFNSLKSVLEQVLEVEPATPIDNRRDGSRTEQAISSLLMRQLPPGWTMHTGCRIVAVDGEVFKNQKMMKGEADVLLVDAQGIVQAVLEVKTARGNPYLALYEDLQRFHNMMELVRGHLVTFAPTSPPTPQQHQQHTQNATGTFSSTLGTTTSNSNAAGPLNSSLLINNSSSSSTSTVLPGAPISAAVGMAAAIAAGVGAVPTAGAPAVVDPHIPSMVTLRFSKNAKPIYVLGSAIHPEDVDAVVRAAQSKLLTMELGRVLSTEIERWKDVTLVELTKEAAILQVPPSSFPQCVDNVRDYFKSLEACSIYMVETS